MPHCCNSHSRRRACSLPFTFLPATLCHLSPGPLLRRACPSSMPPARRRRRAPRCPAPAAWTAAAPTTPTAWCEWLHAVGVSLCAAAWCEWLPAVGGCVQLPDVSGCAWLVCMGASQDGRNEQRKRPMCSRAPPAALPLLRCMLNAADALPTRRYGAEAVFHTLKLSVRAAGSLLFTSHQPAYFFASPWCERLLQCHLFTCAAPLPPALRAALPADRPAAGV